MSDFLDVFLAHKHSSDSLRMIPRTLTDLSSSIKLLCIGLLTFLWADYKRLGMRTWQLKKKVGHVIIQNKTYFFKKMQILNNMAVKTRLSFGNINVNVHVTTPLKCSQINFRMTWTGIMSLLVASSVNVNLLNVQHCFFRALMFGLGRWVSTPFSALIHSTSIENPSTASECTVTPYTSTIFRIVPYINSMQRCSFLAGFKLSLVMTSVAQVGTPGARIKHHTHFLFPNFR